MLLQFRIDGLSVRQDGQQWSGYMSLELGFDWFSEIGGKTYVYRAVLYDETIWVPCHSEETAACLLSRASQLVEGFVSEWNKWK